MNTDRRRRLLGRPPIWGTVEPYRPEGEFVSVSAGGTHTCGVRADGSVVCWGDDGFRQASPPEGTFASVSAGGIDTVGVMEDGSVVGWGNSFRFLDAEGDFASVSAGRFHICALRMDGSLACWGDDSEGQATPP